MELTITVKYNKKIYSLEAELTTKFSDTEVWTVKAKNKEFWLECNRPLLQKRSLEDHAWYWRMTRGECPWPFQKEMQEALERAIRNKNETGGAKVVGIDG